MNFEIKCVKLDKDAVTPSKGSQFSAGWDLSAIKDYEIAPGGCVKVNTGLSFELPANTFGAIFPRSGLATKRGLRLANCVGVCDEDYRGEYIVPLYNDSDEVQIINKGDRIAQLIIMPYVNDDIILVDKLAETERGSGGFGSTGVQ